MMKKITHQTLDNKYTKSSNKIRSILYQSRESSESKISQVTISDNLTELKVVKYVGIARRLHFLYNFKNRSVLEFAFRKLRQTSKLFKQKKKLSIKLLNFVFQQSCLKYKLFAFKRMSFLKLSMKERQNSKKYGLALIGAAVRNINKMDLRQSFLIIRIKVQTQDIIKTYSQIMKTQKQPAQQSADSIPVTLRSPLQQLVTYDRANFVNLTISELKTPLELEVSKITNKANAKGQKLLFIVLNNHLKAIVDLNQNTNANGITNSNSRRSFNQKSSSVMYEELATQFFEGDQQLNKLIVLNMDLAKAQGAIELGIKYFTNRNYRFRSNKIVQSRVKLLELILALLRSSNGQNGSTHEIPPLPELKGKQTSFQQLEVSHVRLIVEQLDHKVYELSTISEQIPQLQTFKRTLDLTMPEHNTYLTKIVDVLIQLHHKVNKLISRRPEKLLRQIQLVEQECLLIETATSQFILKIQSIDQNTRLKPIYFDQRSNKSPDHFRKIQKNVVRFSQILIECIELEAESRQRVVQIKALIQVFWNLIAGMEQYERQWKVYKNRQQKSADEEQIIQLLQLSLKFVNDKMEKMAEEFEIERQAIIDANSKNTQFLEQDISRMSRQNDEQRAIIQQLERQNEVLRSQLNGLSPYELKYKQLLRKYDNDLQDLRSKLGLSEKRQKNYKDKIESLESENEQKKVMITNITNDLKRVMKQSQNSWRLEQKNRDLQQLLDKLHPQLQDLEHQIRNFKQQQQILLRDKQQSERNNDLLIKKLDQANRRVTDLQNEIDNLKHRHERQKNNFKQELDELDKRNKRLSQQFSSNFDNKTKEVEKRQIQHRQSLAKKDQKITELNDKIIDLNSKLNEILGKYKNMEYELQRKQINLEDLTARVKDYEKNNSSQFKDLMKSYQNSQRQLNQALAQIETIRNRTVPDLEAQIKRRDKVITDLQKFIRDLQEKQRLLLVQQQSLNNLKRQRDELETKLRAKEDLLQTRIRQLESALREKDAKLKELQYNNNINVSKINQLESQIRMGSQDKNRLSKEVSRIRDLESQNGKLKSDYDKMMREAQADKHKLKSDYDRKIGDLERQLNRMRQSDAKKNELHSRNQSLESALSERNRLISDLQSKIRTLENSLREQQRELERTKNLTEQLRAKEREISALKQQKLMLEALKSNQNKIKQLLKQIDYLKEKVRSLEDLIDIFNQEYANLEGKFKLYQIKHSSGNNTANNERLQQDFDKLIGNYEKLNHEHKAILVQYKSKQDEILRLKKSLQQADQRYNSPINKKLFEDSASKEKLDQSQREMKILRDRLLLTQSKLNEDSKAWAFREKDYLQQIRMLKSENSNLQARLNQSRNSGQKQGDKYYLRIEGERLEQIMKRMETGSSRVNDKLDEILSNSRRAETTGQSVDLQSVIQQNRTLIEQIRSVMRQKQQLSNIVRDYPNPDFLTEYAFRLITYFSQTHPQSPQSKTIWQQLVRIRRQCSGEQYFIVLQQFTKYTLQECCIQTYRRQLKHKSEQLQQLKIKLNKLIEQMLCSQKVVYEKTALTQSRILMFREKIVTTSNSVNR